MIEETRPKSISAIVLKLPPVKPKQKINGRVFQVAQR
jgi:hypothetical protein